MTQNADSGERIGWYRSRIDKDTMRSLTERSDARGFAQILPQLALSLATGAGAYYAWYHLPLPVALAAVYLHCTFYWFLGAHAAIHELSHGTVFRTKAWNEFFLRLVSFLTWTNWLLYRTSHTKHHQLTVYRGQDLEVELPQKITAWDWLGYLTFDWKWFLHERSVRGIFRHSLGRLRSEWELRLFPESDAAARRTLFGWARFVLAGHLALAVAFVVTHQWILFALVTFAPFVGGWLAWLVTWPQHAGLQHSVPDFRLNCRSMRLAPFLRFLYWNMNYHVEHHMYAAVPFHNLPRLRRTIEADLPPAFPGLVATWKHLLPILKRQRSEPEFAYVPALPQTKGKP